MVAVLEPKVARPRLMRRETMPSLLRAAALDSRLPVRVWCWCAAASRPCAQDQHRAG